MSIRILNTCRSNGTFTPPEVIVRGFARVGLKVVARASLSKPDRHPILGQYQVRSYRYRVVGNRPPIHFSEIDPDPSGFQRHKLHYDIMCQSHMPLIRSIHAHLTSQVRPVWILSGGGMQVQVFFGQANSYLGILYLHLENEPPKWGEKYTLIVQQKKANPLFRALALPDVQVRFA